MAPNDDLIIEFTETQKRNLAARHGISADGLSIDVKRKTIELLNPRAEAAFRLTSRQREQVGKAGIGAEGLTIDPKTFAVEVVKPGDITIAMWGEYAAE